MPSQILIKQVEDTYKRSGAEGVIDLFYNFVKLSPYSTLKSDPIRAFDLCAEGMTSSVTVSPEDYARTFIKTMIEHGMSKYYARQLAVAQSPVGQFHALLQSKGIRSTYHFKRAGHVDYVRVQTIGYLKEDKITPDEFGYAVSLLAMISAKLGYYFTYKSSMNLDELGSFVKASVDSLSAIDIQLFAHEHIGTKKSIGSCGEFFNIMIDELLHMGMNKSFISSLIDSAKNPEEGLVTYYDSTGNHQDMLFNDVAGLIESQAALLCDLKEGRISDDQFAYTLCLIEAVAEKHGIPFAWSESPLSLREFHDYVNTSPLAYKEIAQKFWE